MAYDNQMTIIRQNQSQNVRELLKSKGWIGFVSTYEFMSYCELWVDYCLNGPTDENKKRFKKFDEMMEARISSVQQEVDGIVM